MSTAVKDDGGAQTDRCEPGSSLSGRPYAPRPSGSHPRTHLLPVPDLLASLLYQFLPEALPELTT